LTWRDVSTAYAHAKAPKGGVAYGIHLDVPVVQEMLEERQKMFPKAQPEDNVFLNSRGKPWKAAPADYEDAVKHLKLNEKPRRINDPLEKVDFHTLRHTFASWLAQDGVNLQTIMLLMGHKSIGLTMRYARLNPSYTRKPVAELAAGFADKYGLLSDGEFVYAEKFPANKAGTGVGGGALLNKKSVF
jgi:integrase